MAAISRYPVEGTKVGETLAIGTEAPAIDRHFTTRHPSRTPVSAPAFGEAGLGWRFKQRADHRRPAVAAHTQDEECHLRHQDSPQSFAASAASPSNACGVGGTRNSFCNFHIAIGDEKTSAANLITRTADSRVGGSILLFDNLLKSLVGAQGLEAWTR
jgi:hypothetical protein